MAPVVVQTADMEQEHAPQPVRVPAQPTVRSTHGLAPRQHVDTMAPAPVSMMALPRRVQGRPQHVSTMEPPLHVPVPPRLVLAPLQPVSTMVLPPPARAVVQRHALPVRQHQPAATQRRKQHAVVQAALQIGATQHLLPAAHRAVHLPRTARLPIQRLPRRAVALRPIRVDPAGVLLPPLPLPPPLHQVVREARLGVAAAVVDESIQYNALI